MWTRAWQRPQSGLPQQNHDGCHMNDRQEVAGGLLVTGRHAPVLLHSAPEAFDQVSVFVPIVVDYTLRLSASSTGDDRLASLGLDRADHLLAVIPFVADHHLERHAFEQ